MGPRLFSRGNQGDGDGEPLGLPASMGPRLFSRGNLAPRRDAPRRRSPGFNGATAFQPWKWERPRRLLDRLATGFNGATAFQPWKSLGESSWPA